MRRDSSAARTPPDLDVEAPGVHCCARRAADTLVTREDVLQALVRDSPHTRCIVSTLIANDFG